MFSIFRILDHDTYLDQGSPTTNYGNQLVLLVGKSGADIHRSIIRVNVIKDILDPAKIPHFNSVVGFRLYLYTQSTTNDPNVYVHELEDATTQIFEEGDNTIGATWDHYRNGDANGGCVWKAGASSPFQDYDDTVELAREEITAASTWYDFQIDEWTREKGFEDGDWICLLLKEEEADNDHLASFNSNVAVLTGTYPTTSWRGDEFGGGNIYINGSHGASVPLFSFCEIIYEDEIPEPVTDFSIRPAEDNPSKMEFVWSEADDDDVQGYMVFATTNLDNEWDADGDNDCWGWVDTFTTTGTNDTITCAGRNTWASNEFQNDKLVFTNGKQIGEAHDISANTTAGVLTTTSGFSSGELGYNDMFLIVAPSATANQIFNLETNRGRFLTRNPDDDEYPVWLAGDNGIDEFTANTTYYIFTQAIDNLSLGPRGVKSNIYKFVRPRINTSSRFKIRAASDNLEGTNIDVFEEVFVDMYAVGAKNTVNELKGITRMEVNTGEFRWVSETYTTTLTATWSAGTTISVDFEGVPSNLYTVGTKVVITDGGNFGDLRTIVGVSDTQVIVDAAPSGTYPLDTSIIYPTKTFIYTEEGSKIPVTGRAYNEDGFASEWQGANTAPDVQSVPGVGSLKVGPTEAEKDTTTVNFNMAESIPKPSNSDIASNGYYLDTDETALTGYDSPKQTEVYTSDGTKRPFSYIVDDYNIISPGFTLVYDYDPPTYNDETRDSFDTGGSDIPAMQSASEILYMGFDRPFDGAYFELGSNWSSLSYTKQYWNGSGWTALTVTDGTSNFSQDGKIYWTRPSDWEAVSVDGSDQLYWVRFTVSSVSGPGSISFIVPLELGNNYANITVNDTTVIDLDNMNVLKDGYTMKNTRKRRNVYKRNGVLGNNTKKGIQRIPDLGLKGKGYTVSDNLLSSWSGGEPVFAGAANVNNEPDDIQVLNSIIDNGYLVKVTDENREERNGWIGDLSMPDRPPGHPVHEWSVVFDIEPNWS